MEKNVAKVLKALHFLSVQQTDDFTWARAAKDQQLRVFRSAALWISTPESKPTNAGNS